MSSSQILVGVFVASLICTIVIVNATTTMVCNVHRPVEARQLQRDANCYPEDNTILGVSFSNVLQKYALVGLCGKQITYLSTDCTGRNWIPTKNWTLDNLFRLNSVAYGGEQHLFVSVGGAYKVVYSTDGFHWLQAKIPDSQSYYFNRVRFLNVNANGNQSAWFFAGASNTILYSPNGIEWEMVNRQRLPIKDLEIYNFATNGAGLVVAGSMRQGDQGSAIIYTMDPLFQTWKHVTGLSTSSTLVIKDIAYSARRGLFVGAGSIKLSPDDLPYCVIVTSNNGVHWKYSFNCTKSEEDGSTINAIAYQEEEDMFVAVGTLVAVSNNGVQWKIVPQENYPRELYSCVQLMSLHLSKQQFVAVGNYDMVWISTNRGMNWTDFGPKV